MKKIYLLLTLLLLFIGISSINALDTTLKVYDNAEILTDEEETLLRESINNYIEKYNMDMILVTEKNNTAGSAKKYAEDFYDYNGFGIGRTNDGVLFIIDLTEGYKDIYMTTTGEAIKMYDDNRIDSILDGVADEKDNGYYNMFKAFIDSSSSYAELGIPDSNKNAYIDSNGDYKIKTPISTLIIRSIIPGAIISTIVLIVLIFKNKMVRKSTNANYYLREGSVVIETRNDRFIATHTTSHRINTDSGSSSRGGSSISRGSSGASHGGGGRRL